LFKGTNSGARAKWRTNYETRGAWRTKDFSWGKEKVRVGAWEDWGWRREEGGRKPYRN